MKYPSVQTSPEEMNILIHVKILGGRFRTGEGYLVACNEWTVQRDWKTKHDDGTVHLWINCSSSINSDEFSLSGSSYEIISDGKDHFFIGLQLHLRDNGKQDPRPY